MSVDINISNYETFLLSFIDNELNAEEAAALEQFLQQHPHIRRELEALEATRLQPDQQITFTGREQLYRHAATLTPENYEPYLLDYVDNELGVQEQQMLEQLMDQRPDIRKELALLQAARLQPDLSVQFPNKASLYRRRATVRPIWWWSAAAAVVAALVVWLLPMGQQQDKGLVKQMADRPAAPGSGQAGTAQRTPAGTEDLQQLPAGTVGSGQVPAGTAHTPVGSEQAPAGTAHSPVAPQQQPAGIAHTQQSPAGTGITHQPQPAPATPSAAKPGQLLASRQAPQSTTQQKKTTDKPAPAGKATDALAGNSQPAAKQLEPIREPALAQQLPQPVTTSAEVVQQHQEKLAQDLHKEEAATAATPPARKEPVLAANANISHTPAAAPATAAPVQGELIMSVTSNGESRLLNGVASVARLFAKKKK